jgi:hypothetical protein
LDTALSAPSIDVTTFQASGKVLIPAWPEMSIAQAGYIVDVDANQLEKAIYDRLGAENSPYHVAALYGTDTPGCPAYVLPAAASSDMQITTQVDSVLTITATWISGSGAVGGRRGYRVADQAVSATGPLAAVDFGAAGANGGTAYLFVRSITGTATNATITVQSDTAVGFPAPATEGTFTFSAIGSRSIALSGVIGRYVRLNVTSLGGATGLTIGAIVCVNGVTC